MITYTFTVNAKNLLKLQELVKLTNARFSKNPAKIGEHSFLVKIDFLENSDLMRFLEERNRTEAEIVEINKPKSLFSKFISRCKLLFRR